MAEVLPSLNIFSINKHFQYPLTEKPPARDRHDWPLAVKPVPPVRSSSQPSMRDQQHNDDASFSFHSRTLPRDTRVMSQQEPDQRDQYYNQNQSLPHSEQNGGI